MTANMASLINCARQKGKWDFICRSKQMALITCLEDSTNEVELHSQHLFQVYFKLNFQEKVEAL